jgi:hypothetical protein
MLYVSPELAPVVFLSTVPAVALTPKKSVRRPSRPEGLQNPTCPQRNVPLLPFDALQTAKGSISKRMSPQGRSAHAGKLMSQTTKLAISLFIPKGLSAANSQYDATRRRREVVP